MRECFKPDGFGWKYLTFANPYPLPNVHLLVSAENQPTADERIPILMDTPAAVRGVSLEPMLGPVRLPWVERAGPPWMSQPQPVGTRAAWIPPPRLDWVIVGGESGSCARPMHPDWVRAIRDQCVAAGIPFFFKGWGEWAPIEMLNEDQIQKAADTEKYPYMKFAFLDRYGKDDPSLKKEYCQTMVCVGKKEAGRKLDGKVWDQMPERRS